MQDLVVAIARAWICDATSKRWRVSRHRREPILRPGFGVALGWHHHHDRGWIMVDVIADGIQAAFRFAGLTGGHDHHAFDHGVADGIHDAALIFGPGSRPRARFGARLGTQSPFGIGPVTDAQFRRRGQDRKRPFGRLGQPWRALQRQRRRHREQCRRRFQQARRVPQGSCAG